MNASLLEQISLWLEDSSFQNWAMQTNTKDVEKWEKYLNDFPENRDLVEITRSIILGLPFREIPKEEERKARILQAMEKQLDARKMPKLQPVYRRTWFRAAASVVILVSLIGSIYVFFWQNREVVFATDFGEKKELILPDQSKVTLNANSEIRYYRQEPRKINLKGEAFFEVSKKPSTNAKFQVFTKDLTVNVIGTIFNVNSRQDRTKVFLEEGKVRLEMNDTKEIQKTFDMQPGQLVIYSKKEQYFQNNKTEDALPNTSWKDGTMVFKGIILPQVIESMKEIYGIQMHLLNKELEQRSVTIALPNEDLNVAIETLKNALNVEVKQEKLDGEMVYLIGK